MILEVYNGSIRITKKLGDAFKSVVANEPYREFLNYVYFDSDKKTINATDGKQLLVLEVKDSFLEFLPNKCSYYDITKGRDFSYLVPVVDKGGYPDLSRIVGAERVRYEVGDGFNISGNKEDNAIVFYHFSRAVKTPVNTYKIEKCLKHLEDFRIYSSHISETGMLRCWNGEWEYIIQGMYLDLD